MDWSSDVKFVASRARDDESTMPHFLVGTGSKSPAAPEDARKEVRRLEAQIDSWYYLLLE
jgi:hypothetical protein